MGIQHQNQQQAQQQLHQQSQFVVRKQTTKEVQQLQTQAHALQHQHQLQAEQQQQLHQQQQVQSGIESKPRIQTSGTPSKAKGPRINPLGTFMPPVAVQAQVHAGQKRKVFEDRENVSSGGTGS